MSEHDPRRLRDGGGELGSLLDAGKSEVPTDAQLMGLAAKIGVLGGIGGAGAAGGGGAGGAGTGAGAGAGAAIKGGLAVKVIGAVALASVAGAGAVAVSTRPAETVAPVGIVATEGPSGSTSASTSTSVEEEAPVASASSRVVTRAPRVAEGPAAEVKLVEQAQDALRSRPAEALALCNDHAKRFPNGIVTQECEVITIEALVKTGRKDEARQRAARFKARFPGSAAIRRLDVLVGD